MSDETDRIFDLIQSACTLARANNLTFLVYLLEIAGSQGPELHPAPITLFTTVFATDPTPPSAPHRRLRSG